MTKIAYLLALLQAPGATMPPASAPPPAPAEPSAPATPPADAAETVPVVAPPATSPPAPTPAAASPVYPPPPRPPPPNLGSAAAPAAAQQPLATPPPQLPPPALPPLQPSVNRHKQARDLMFAGLAGFAFMYGVTAITGAAIHDAAPRINHNNPAQARTVGLRLLIPVVGPFAAIPPIRHDAAKIGAGFLGVLQAFTLIALVTGTGQYIASRTRRVQPTVTLTPREATLSIAGRF